MMYPVGNLGLLGLLVGVATHSAIVGKTRSAEDTRLQAQADKVLEPYRASLDGLRLRSLQEGALSRLPAGAGGTVRSLAEAPAGELVVQVAPQFSLTPDAAAMVLDAVVGVGRAGSTQAPASTTIRVVSLERPEADLRAAWNSDGGMALRSTAASLMAEAVHVATARAGDRADETVPWRTIRYMQGGLERMERGQLLGKSCDRMLVRTLRGSLMSVPYRGDAPLPAGCPAPAPIAKHVTPEAAEPDARPAPVESAASQAAT